MGLVGGMEFLFSSFLMLCNGNLLVSWRDGLLGGEGGGDDGNGMVVFIAL